MTDVTTLSMRVAEEIRVLMVRKHVNQKQLAQRIGQSAMWVSGRLTGQTEIAVNDLPRIAGALDVTIAELLPAEARRPSGGEPTVRYEPVTLSATRTLSRPVDNRPSGKPSPGSTNGGRRTARLPRPDRRRAA